MSARNVRVYCNTCAAHLQTVVIGGRRIESFKPADAEARAAAHRKVKPGHDVVFTPAAKEVSR